MWKNIKIFDSSEGNVSKFVFEGDKVIAEAVLYKYESFEKRTVICCSVQSGCNVGCTFCGTGKRFIRNLTAQEIVEQIKEVVKKTGVTDINARCEKFQIMFMSMGEPFLNYKEVEKAIVELNELYPNAQLLLSTIGVKKSASMFDFLHLSNRIEKIGLQFSIHEAIDAKRDILIPYEKKLTLREIRDYGIKWSALTKRPVYLNYCITEDNANDEDIQRLKDLFSPAVFNFTFSVVCEADENLKSKSYDLHGKINEVMSSFVEDGYNVRKFDPAGQDDIGGGCGQLWYTQEYMSKI